MGWQWLEREIVIREEVVDENGTKRIVEPRGALWQVPYSPCEGWTKRSENLWCERNTSCCVCTTVVWGTPLEIKTRIR